MEIISKGHKQFLLRLIKSNTEFILIGGYAVIYHGYPRLTMDMDLWIKPNNDNKIKLLDALRSYGVVDEGIEQVKNFDFTQTQSFYIGEEKNRIDFLTSIAGVSYLEADAQKVLLKIEGKNIPVISFEHLIVNKMISGRPQDKADVDILQKVQEAKDNE